MAVVVVEEEVPALTLAVQTTVDCQDKALQCQATSGCTWSNHDKSCS